jgi:predicted metal-dependent phosphoesterase TrpH
MEKRKYKLDLHSHSIISHDGGITAEEYEGLFERGTIDCIAITDHNETKFALELQQKLGKRIIVGEEIMTTGGEIIGLFLSKTVPKGLAPQEAIRQIQRQRGLVYIPHPFETIRKGIQPETAEEVKKDVDIVEIFNSRAIGRGKPQEAWEFAKREKLAMAASGDAHVAWGVGHSYSLIAALPERDTLVELLQQATYIKHYAPFFTLLFPFFNRVRKKF